MQLMIDFTTATVARLRDAAAMLVREADRLDGVPEGTVAAPVPPAPAAIIPPPPPAPDTTATTASAASTAPSAPSAPAGVDPNAQLDKRGFPYDARIHSAGANINKSDGLWRTKRGVENALIESVEAELRERGYGVAVPPAPLAPPAASVPPPPPPAPGAVPPPPPPPSVSLPVGTGTPGQPPAVPSGQDAGQVDQFRVLMNTIGGHTGPDGKCRREIMAPVYERLLGKPGGLPDFHKARDKIPELLVEVRRLIGA
jgi:hypothetical protein